jgi:hypothetical protein
MQAERIEITTTKVVWKLSAPADWSEVHKVFSIAARELLDQYQTADDVVQVECHDEQIWITYDRKYTKNLSEETSTHSVP